MATYNRGNAAKRVALTTLPPWKTEPEWKRIRTAMAGPSASSRPTAGPPRASATVNRSA